MAWITPKTDWTSADGVDFNDLNRIEGDIAFIATNPSSTILQLAPDGGNVVIGTTNDTYNGATSRLSLTGGTYQIVGKNVDTDSTQKLFRIASGVYDNSKYPMGIIYAICSNVANTLIIGGGTSVLTTPTVINFNTAAAIDTTVGTTAMTITSDQHILIGTLTNPGETLHIGAGGMRVTGTTDNVIIDATGLLTAGDAVVDRLFQTSSVIIQGTGLTENDVYDALSSILPIVGDQCILTGMTADEYTITVTDFADTYGWSIAERITSTRIRITGALLQWSRIGGVVSHSTSIYSANCDDGDASNITPSATSSTHIVSGNLLV